MTGYAVGPTLPPDQYPFKNDGWPNWEQDPHVDDGHHHEWESVLLEADGKKRLWVEEVIRCADCHAPRCGYSSDPDPCMERRHHRWAHHALSGRTWPLGGSR
jgi:hypothetical protein